MAVATIRDQLLSVVDAIRNLPPFFGVRRFAVTIRRRVWSGQVAGEGTATDYNILLIPAPKVRDITSRDMTVGELEYKAANNNTVAGNLYKISGITPQYLNADGTTGGYKAEQIRLWPNTDTGAVDNLVSLVGDDGYLRECVQVSFEQDRAFGYSMIVKEIDRPRTPLTSIAINPATATVAHGKTQQLSCVGAFAGNENSILTTLTAWSSSNTGVATVDVYGNVTAVAAGTATITATCLGQTATATITVT